MKLSLPERIETDRLILARLKYEEAEEIFYTYASKAEATKFMSWPTHNNLEDTRTFLKYAVSGWSAGTDYSYGIRLKKNHRFIGSCGILNDEGKVQFGYILSPTHWGMGFATEVCRKLMQVVRTVPEVYRISTFVDVENVASSKVLLKSGLVEEARLEKWFKFINQNSEPKDCFLYKLPL
ncbi:MAG: GNAT family N-acetyltransferase [Cyclobacteriaceae bacterium]|nr:GNAT family N-acetyltransferase [Cyclobacteriaceae bacterium]